MSLPQPDLDDKTRAPVATEETVRTPRHAPDWTDHNRHDPGITFVELFSWLAEMQQFYLNRVGDESYVKFLKLLGLRAGAATQATADVTFSGATTDGVIVPRGTRLTTSDAVADAVIFETEEALRVVVAELKKILSSSKNSLKDNTDANAVTGLSFYDFGEGAEVGRRLYSGFDQALSPKEDVSLTITLFEGYAVARGSPGGEPASIVPSALIVWEYYDAVGRWKPLEIVTEIEDAIAATASDEPSGASVCFKQKEQFLSLVKDSFSYKHLSEDAREFFDSAADEAVSAQALRRALYDAPFLLLKGDETLMLSQSGRLRFTAPPDGFWRQTVIHPFEDNLYWLRATVLDGAYELPPRIATVRLNTVSASQRDTQSEVVSFDGDPQQPLEADSCLALFGVNTVQVRERDGRWKDWEDKSGRADPFADSGPNDEHYAVSKSAGKLILNFGDGVRGKIPPEGSDSIRLVSYLPAFEEPRMIGRSTGLPNQTFSLSQTSVVAETLVVQVEERVKLERVVTETKEVACLLRFARTHEFVREVVAANYTVRIYEVRISLEAKQELCNVELRERLRGRLRFRAEDGSRCHVRFGEDAAVFSIKKMRAGELLECNYFVEVGEAGGSLRGEVIISLASECPTVVEESPTSVVKFEEATEETRWRDWIRVDDFDASGPNDPHFVLDAAAGTISFGDGINGDIPQALASETEKNIRVISFQSGGGQRGNVAATAVNAFAKPFGVTSSARLLALGVSNAAASSGGADEEELEDAEARARRDLKTQYRGVTTDDIEYLALSTPGLRGARARAIPLFAPALKGYPQSQVPASVTVVVVPYSPALRPFPSEGFVRTVCRHLDRHRLLTTRVHVVGPEYVGVGVQATVKLFAELGQAETLAEIE